MTLGYLASGLVMALSSVTVLRHRLTTPPPIHVVVAVWLASGLAMVIVTAWLSAMAQGIALSLSPAEALRFAILHVLKIAVPVIGVTLLDTGLARARELRRSTEARHVLVVESAQHLDTLRDRHLEVLRDRVMSRLRTLSDEVSALLARPQTLDLGDLPQRIGSFGRGEVRDLSHRVARGEFVSDLDVRATQPFSPHEVRRFLAATFSVPAPAAASAALYLFLVTGWSALAATVDTLTIVVVQALAIMMVLTAARHLASALPATSTPTRVLITLASGAAAVAAVVWVQQPDTPLSSLPAVAQASSAIAGTLLVAGAIRQQRALLTALAEADSCLSAQIVDLRREAEHIRHRIAQLLHGTIQGRLALTSLRLTELGAVAEPAAQALARDEVLSLLTSIETEFHAAEHVEVVLDAAPLEIMLDAVSRDWAGLLACSWSIDHDARKALHARPLLSREVADIITEAVVNARRHGDASTVTAAVAVATVAPLALRITVTDDGHGPTTDTQPGLGHTTLASLGARWALIRDEQCHTVLVITLPASDETISLPATDRTPALVS